MNNFKNLLAGKLRLLLLSALLFIIAFISGNNFYKEPSVEGAVNKLEKYIHRLQIDFNEFLDDASLINKIADKKESAELFKKLTKKKYGIYLFSADFFGTVSMKFWNQQFIIPPPEIQGYADGEYYMTLSNGQYLVVKKTISTGEKQNNVVVCAMILIRYKFYTETAYLQDQFPSLSKVSGKRVIISEVTTPFPVKALSGKTLCFLDKKAAASIRQNGLVTNLVLFTAILLLVIFIHLLAESKFRKIGAWKSILLLTGQLLGLRILTYLFPSILNLRQFHLFDPEIYGSNPVQSSLGDLLINSILLCWIVLYAWSKIQAKEYITAGWSKKGRWIAGLGSLGLLFISTFMLASLIRSLVADSNISFDVTDFVSLTMFTVIGFAILTVFSITYYYLSRLLFLFMLPLTGERKELLLFVIGFAGLVYLTLRPGPADVLFYIPVLLWLLIYSLFLLNQKFLFTRFRINIANILFWIFIFSVSISVLMFSEIKKKEWEKRKFNAYKVVENSDPSGERLLNITLAYLDRGFLSENFYRFYDKADSKKFRDSIIAENFSVYQNKYETKIYVYDSTGKSINNDDPLPLNTLNTILAVQAKPTKYPDIFYYEIAYDKFTYITKKEFLSDNGSPMGFLFVTSNPWNNKSDALFPELFRQLKQGNLESSSVYSYAVYENKELVSPANKYSFAATLNDSEIPQNEYERRSKEGYDELWFRASGTKVVVIAREQGAWVEAITLFSYIFCSFLVLVGIVKLISNLLNALYDRKRLAKLLQFNIRNQVHITIIFISIFSFLIIGFSTISFFINRYSRNNTDKLSSIMQIMVNEMRKKMADQEVFDDVMKIYDPVAGTGLEKLVKEVADVHNVDVNVYDLNGDLQVSSETYVYTIGAVSKKMDPTAYFHLNRLKQVQHVQEESIAELSYLSIYAPVRHKDGRVDAYLNIPFFASQRELDQEISNFLVTIINLNAFIFLIAGVIALFIANRITRSFSLISDKMKEVNLASVNEAIEWNRNDEIGELVKEYNKMVAKLEESAASLAKSEREGAWREMARQVAHEIKNPLTPMKLSIQYLQKSIDSNQPNIKDLTSNVSKTLVEQIDHLSKIAADFSQFANIGNIKAERFDLHDIIGSLKELYRANPNVEFNWLPIAGRAIMEADKTQMNRLFTNLFANAVEARHGQEICRIEVREIMNEDKVIISVKDSGEGIAHEMQSRIFEPNFTTKSSGTGLGLAMCKSIVEQAKGKIWFETEEGKGTIFYVELPVVD